MRHSDIALPTFDDEQQLFGDKSPGDTLKRIHYYGVSEVVLKVGPEGCWVSGDVDAQQIKGSAVTQPVDTTAAGDSFNAGYLGGRLHNDSMLDAAQLGNRLAGIVIGHRGAIVPRSAMSHLDSLPRR